MANLNNRSAGQWRGYTLDEMRYQRALLKARMEIEKYRLSIERERFDISTGINGRSMLSKVMSVFSYTDYAVFAFRMVRKIVPLFRRKRQ